MHERAGTLQSQEHPIRPSPDRADQVRIRDAVGERVYDAVQKVLPKMHGAQVLGIGGSSIVLELTGVKKPDKAGNRQERVRNIVARVDYSRVIDQAFEYARGEYDSDKTEASLEETREKQEEMFRELREYFGPAAVEPHRTAIMDVPVEADAVRNLMRPHEAVRYQELVSQRGDEAQLPTSFPTLVTLRPRVREAEFEDAVSLNGGYPESVFGGFEDEGAAEWMAGYRIGNRLLTAEPGSERIPREEALRTVFRMYPGLKHVYEQVMVDDSFRDALADLVKRMVVYTEETGNVLDLTGHNNILLQRLPKGWRVRMLDPFYGDTESMMRGTNAVGKMIRESEGSAAAKQAETEVSPQEACDALNVLNTTRVINALAIFADIPDRVHVAGLDKVLPHAWLQAADPFFSWRREEPERTIGRPVTVVTVR